MEDPAIYQTVLGLHTKTKHIVTCRYCQGSGTVERRKFFGHTDGWIPSNHVCGVCNGKRVLERTIEITYKEIS